MAYKSLTLDENLCTGVVQELDVRDPNLYVKLLLRTTFQQETLKVRLRLPYKGLRFWEMAIWKGVGRKGAHLKMLYNSAVLSEKFGKLQFFFYAKIRPYKGGRCDKVRHNAFSMAFLLGPTHVSIQNFVKMFSKLCLECKICRQTNLIVHRSIW